MKSRSPAEGASNSYKNVLAFWLATLPSKSSTIRIQVTVPSFFVPAGDYKPSCSPVVRILLLWLKDAPFRLGLPSAAKKVSAVSAGLTRCFG